MKTIKQLLTTIAVLLCSIMAHAHDFEIDGIRYDITSFTDLTVKASSVSESITNELSIPSKVQFNGKELSVIEVSDEFAISNTTISSLTINDGITYIGEKAFKNCTHLTTINIAQSVTQIGKECFYGCTALKNFNNQGIITLGIKSFAECNNLEEISIENLDSLKEGTFINCTKLTNCNLPNIKSIEKEAFKNCQSLKEYNIPNNVTSIGESAFEGCSNISMIIIPNNVYELGKNAFNHCTSLTSISIGSGLTFLPWVFEGCTNLSDIKIEDSPTTLTFGYTGDEEKSWDGFIYGKDVSITYNSYPAMFVNFNIKNVYIGRNITTEKFCYSNQEHNSYISKGYYIPNSPFSSSTIESLTIGALVSDLKMSAPTTNADFSRGTWNGAFQNCKNLDSIILLSTATSIPENTFRGCIKINHLEIPNCVKEIGNNALNCCTNLKTLTLGSYLKSIGANALDSCNSLTEINLKSPIPPTYKTGFSSAKYISTKLNVPSINLDNYQNADPWKNFWNISGKNDLISLFEVDNINYSVIEGKNVEIINNNISKPTNLLIKNEIEYYGTKYNVVAISNAAFKNCSHLSSIQIETGIKTIGHEAFENCINLNTINIPSDLQSIGIAAFKNCSQLNKIILPQILTIIPDECFKECTSLDSIIIPQNITDIGAYAFNNCRSLNKIIIPQNVNIIGEYALTGCNNLKELILEDGETPLHIFHKGDYDKNTGYIKVDNKNLYFIIEYYYSCFSGLPIQKLYIGRNLSNESRYSISEKKYGDQRHYHVITSYDAPFSNLPYLKNLIIGENVNILGSEEEYISEMNLYVTPGSFKNCSSIQTIEVKNPTPPTGAEFTSSAYSNAQLKVPVGSIEQYKNDSIWKNFINLMKFNITYAIDDNIYLTELITFGDTIILPETPTKEGYTFKGWSEIPETMPAEDITIIGSFAINTYAITYIVDGEIFATDSLSYSSEIILPEYPQKEGHSFSGWRLEDGRSVPKTMPAKNLTITGTFTTNSYWTTYYVDDKFYCDTRRTYGKDISLIEEPEKKGYTFSGWKIEGFDEIPETMPAQNLKIIGYFTINNYAVNYVIDGEKYATDSVVYGSEIILRDEPEKEGYTFSGWSETPDSMPANDITITGSFSINTYAITYMIDDEVFAIDSLTYGSKIVLRDEPEKEGYVFSGWSEAPETMPANDITITGSFDATAIQNVTIDATNIEIKDNSIILQNINNSTITIYTINGVLVKSIDNYTGEEIALDKGLYIVCIGNESIKIKI